MLPFLELLLDIGVGCGIFCGLSCDAWGALIPGLAIASPLCAMALARPVGRLLFRPPEALDARRHVDLFFGVVAEAEERTETESLVSLPPGSSEELAVAEDEVVFDDVVVAFEAFATSSGGRNEVGDSTMGVMESYMMVVESPAGAVAAREWFGKVTMGSRLRLIDLLEDFFWTSCVGRVLGGMGGGDGVLVADLSSPRCDDDALAGVVGRDRGFDGDRGCGCWGTCVEFADNDDGLRWVGVDVSERGTQGS